MDYTESKHIKDVKEPWQWSSHYKALSQIVCTISWLDKLATLHQLYVQCGMMAGTTSAYITQNLKGTLLELVSWKDGKQDDDENDVALSPRLKTLTSVTLPS